MCFLGSTAVFNFVKSQSITLGTGTAVNGTTASSPVNIWYRRCVNQAVYTVAELNAAGITGPATIRQLGYYVTQAPVYAIPDYQISIKHTTATNANTNLGGGFTIVKNAFNYSPEAGGWDLLNLDTPFNWNGTQNIAVKICWSQIQPTYDASGQCRIYTTTNGYRYRWDDNGGNACAGNPNTTTTNKPQIHFIFDTVTVWTGAVNNQWTNAGNWTRGIPNIYMDARIPTGTPNDPNVTTSVVCQELILEGNLTLSSTGTLNIHSHFNNTGSFNDLGGITIMTGKNTSQLSGNFSFSNLRIENEMSCSVVTGTVDITRELQVNNSIFSTGDAVTLKSTPAGTARINELKNSCTYTLNMTDSYGDGWNGGFLTVLDDGVSLGTFAASGFGSTETFTVESGSVITLQYTSGSWENENSFTLSDPTPTVIFSDNAPIATGTIFNGTSSCNFTPVIVGNITMERYIDAGETYWRNFSSAVSGAQISQYLDDFLTAGFPGSPWPAFPFNSIYTYDETLGAGSGWVGCTGTSQVIELGQGLYVWSGDTITGTDPFLVDLTGAANQGEIVFPISYTNFGVLEEDGWNFIGNPYASTIDWDSPNWIKTNIADAIYIMDPDNQQFASYVSGASTNGGSRYIASQQAFWVYASAASPQLIARESVKSNVDANFFKAGTYSPGMSIKLIGNGYSDESVIRHIDGATDNYDMNFDAPERWGGWGEVQQLSVMNESGIDFSIHSREIGSQEMEIPLRTIVFQSGEYNLHFSNLEELNLPCLILEDTYTDSIYTVESGSNFTFYISDTTWSPRFILHVGKNYTPEVFSAACFSSNDGYALVDLDDTALFNYVLTDPSGNQTNLSGQGDPLEINNLSAGNYTVFVEDLNNSCNQNLFDITIESPAEIIVMADTQNEVNGNDANIVLNVFGGTPPYTILWSTSDTTQFLNDITEGIYSVEITDSNGCSITETFEVSSQLTIEEVEKNQLTYYYDAENGQLVFTSSYSGKIEILDAAGKVIYSNDNFVCNDKSTLRIDHQLSRGIYFIHFIQANEVGKFVK